MLRICICDDVKRQRMDLKSIICTSLELNGIDFTITECESGEDVLSLLMKGEYNFDIIFLDIEMNNRLNGIETAKQVRALNETVVIIFVTGFADYVFDGYEVRAFNYILKPYKKEKIIDVLLEALKQVKQLENKFFLVQTNKNVYKICLSEIIYFASDKRKIKVVTGKKVYELYGKMDDIEKGLPDFFVRIHQRYLVNLNHVLSITNNYVEIRNEKLPISRRKYQDVIIAFAKTMLG